MKEYRRGEVLFCLEEFCAGPVGLPFFDEDFNENRVFAANERVIYAGRYKSQGAWMLIFRADDGVEYEAEEDYFVSEDEAWLLE